MSIDIIEQASWEEALGISTQPALENLPDVCTPDEYKQYVAQQVTALKARAEAKRIVEAEQYSTVAQPQVLTLNDLDKLPPLKYRIDGLIPENTKTVIIAPAKTGKTTLVYNLIYSLTEGQPFLGHFACPQQDGGVALLNYEMNAAMAREWLHKLGIRSPQFRFVDTVGNAGWFTSHTGRDKLAQQLQGTTALVVDSFGQAFTGSEQNNNTEVAAWLRDFEQWARHDIGIRELYVIMHAGKGSEGARGASALQDWPDIQLILSKLDPDNPNSPRYIKTIGRSDDLMPHRLNFDHATGKVTLGRAETPTQGRKTQKAVELMPAILAYLTANSGGQTQSSLAKGIRSEGISMDDKALRQALNMLTEEGKIIVTPKGRSNVYEVNTLTAENMSNLL